ncbi:MAG: tetratricopeptide repeat protein [Balneola sp.]|nr:tetratricopeptide repeat protein [Balneola sp.]MBO6651229.1 tetratricopeptide repeat protein [Balneola sp.]MBO6712024.1 tetratricopeptide repeat protein [Balneola sp.]MBO6800218.1 tetratricopeptide repeat protein [Balneola sp.]MBO6869768.1 tetratricopeptide repeat protein [Balneola sp.]
MDFRNLVAELKRRNVFRVATAYAIAGWLIIQICATTFPFLSLPEWLITAVIIFVTIGFPLSLIFAWAFELTPDGLKKSQEVDITESVTHRTGKKLNGIIITVLSMAVIFLLVERVFFAEAAFIENQSEFADFQTASIAVLPFVDMSAGQDQEYFSDGLSEELLNALAKVKDMKVAGRTSSFKFKGQNENLKLIGDELNVEHILEGSVRKSGNRIRITAQLIKAEDGFHLWSETFDRELTATNLFDIQEEISKEVLKELKVRLLDEEEKDIAESPTDDIEAYNFYLKGTQYEAIRLESDLKLAIQQYQEAVRIDPTFAKAYARMAIAYELLSGYGALSNEDRLNLVRENVDQALFLDQNLPEAYAALGLMYQSNGELQKGIEALNKALELNPNYALAYSWLGNLYLFSDEQKTIKLFTRAYEIDPLNQVVSSNYVYTLMLQDRNDEAIEQYNELIKQEPKQLLYYYRVGVIKAYSQGKIREAFELYFDAKEIDPDASFTLANIGLLSIDIGMEGYFDQVYSEVVQKYPDSGARIFLEFWGLYKERKYEDLALFIQKEFESGHLQEVIDDFQIFAIYTSLKNLNRYELLDQIISKIYPELTQNSIRITKNNHLKAIFWAKSLKERGQEEAFQKLIDPICDFGESEREKLKTNPESDDYLYPSLFCADFKEDREAFLAVFEEYKERQNLFLVYFDLLEVEPVWEFAKQPIPEIELLKEKAKTHMESEFRKSVEFLKIKGEWNDSWRSTFELREEQQ